MIEKMAHKKFLIVNIEIEIHQGEKNADFRHKSNNWKQAWKRLGTHVANSVHRWHNNYVAKRANLAERILISLHPEGGC